jgi:site-specific DNA recombinase
MTASDQPPRTLYGIGYCRVSRDEQEEGTSLDDQAKEIAAYAKANGIILIDILREAYTGTVYRERKVLSQLRERYRRGEANCVIVRTFDRLARNETHFAVLLDEMEHYGVELHCVKENLDDSIMGRLARSIIAAFAEFEHQKIIDRTNTGKRNRVLLKKEFIPGNKPPYGFDWNNPAPKEKTALVIKQQEAQTALRIHTLYDKGVSISTIVRTLIAEGVPPPAHTWNRKTVLRILRDERYTGHGMAFTKHKRNAK